MNKKVLLITIVCTVCNASLYGMFKKKMLFNKNSVASIAALWKQKSFNRIDKEFADYKKINKIKEIKIVEKDIWFSRDDKNFWTDWYDGEFSYVQNLCAKTCEPVEKIIDVTEHKQSPYPRLQVIYEPTYGSNAKPAYATYPLCDRDKKMLLFGANNTFIVFFVDRNLNSYIKERHALLWKHIAKNRDYWHGNLPVPNIVFGDNKDKIDFDIRIEDQNLEFIADLGEFKDADNCEINKMGTKIVIGCEDGNYSLIQLK